MGLRLAGMLSGVVAAASAASTSGQPGALGAFPAPFSIRLDQQRQQQQVDEAMPQPTRMAPWCIEGHRKGCSWAEEVEKPGLLHNLTANKPALVLFYVPESIEGVALKEVMTNVSLFVNTKHFHRKDSDGKPTVPFVRFYTVNVGETTKNKPLEGHNKDVDAIRKAYGVKSHGAPQIVYYPGGDAFPGDQNNHWVKSREMAVKLDGPWDKEHEVGETKADNGVTDFMRISEFVQTQHRQVFPLGKQWGKGMSEEEKAAIPPNCDGDECNDLQCPERYQPQVLLKSAGITHAECECECRPARK